MTLVAHVDLDAFFASAAIVADPTLKGKPVAVGGRGPHGVVSTANYVAREFGVGAGMRMREALSRCHDLVVVGVDFSWYRELSFEVLAAEAEIAEVLEPASIDEAYLSFSREVTFDNVKERANELRRRITARTGLTASVGVGVSRGVAKLASDVAKPDGICVVRPEETRAFLDDRRLKDLGGAGPATLAKLFEMGVHSVAGLAAQREADVRHQLGEMGVQLWKVANGTDGAQVHVGGVQSSVGTEETLDESVSSLDDFAKEVERQEREALSRLQRLGRGASGVALKARGVDFHDVSRAASFGRATNDAAVVHEALARLIEPTWRAIGGAIRLVGVSLTGLEDAVQPRLDFSQTSHEWEMRRSPRAGEQVLHQLFGIGEVVVGDPDSAVVRFSDRVRVINDPRAYLERVGK